MPNIKPLIKTEDQYCGYAKYSNYNHAASMPAVSVSINEIKKLNGIYPLLFAKTTNTSYRLVALLGLYGSKNLFVLPNGKWFSPYVPAQLRSYPFSLQNVKVNDKIKQLLCIDKDSELYKTQAQLTNDDTRFYSDDGKLDDSLQQTLNFLKQLTTDNLITQKAVDAIAEHQLLVPLQFKPSNNTTEEPIKGLYRIDEQKFKSLEADTLKQLQETNGLAIIYSSLFSISIIDKLAKMDMVRSQQQEQQPNIEDMDIDNMFADDIIKF